MADISALEEGVKAAEMGADMLSTTLSGYTLESPMKKDSTEIEIHEAHVSQTDVQIVKEGRI